MGRTVRERALNQAGVTSTSVVTLLPAVGTKQKLGRTRSGRPIDRVALAASRLTRGSLHYFADVPTAFDVTVRQGRELADYLLGHLSAADREVCLQELVYAACEGLRTQDWWPLAELLNGWEATAEVEADPGFAEQVDAAIAESRARR